MSKPLLIKILVALAVLIGLIIFNVSMRPLGSTDQKNFEEWFIIADARLRSGQEVNPEIAISLGSPGDQVSTSWTISSRVSEKRPELIRLLELANASRVFDLPKPTDETGKGFVLRVTEGPKEFVALVTPERASSQINLQVLLKLFAEYAGHSSSATAAS